MEKVHLGWLGCQRTATGDCGCTEADTLRKHVPEPHKPNRALRAKSYVLTTRLEKRKFVLPFLSPLRLPVPPSRRETFKPFCLKEITPLSTATSAPIPKVRFRKCRFSCRCSRSGRTLLDLLGRVLQVVDCLNIVAGKHVVREMPAHFLYRVSVHPRRMAFLTALRLMSWSLRISTPASANIFAHEPRKSFTGVPSSCVKTKSSSCLS